MSKVREAAEKHRAKTMIKRPDADVGDVKTFTQDNRVAAKYNVTEIDPKTGRLVEKPYGVQVGKEVVNPRDIEKLSLSELDILMKRLNKSLRYINNLDPKYKDIFNQLKTVRDAYIAKLPKSRGKKFFQKMSDLSVAREDLGIDRVSSLRTDVDAARKVNTISELLGKSSDSARNKKEMVYKHLKKADPKFGKDVQTRGEKLEDLKDILGMEDIRTQNIKGLLGAATTLVGKGSNVAGMTRHGTGKAATKVKDVFVGTYKSLKEASPEKLQGLASAIEQKGGAGLTYANQLRKAATSDGKGKQALLHGLYQQPAFRETIRDLNPFAEDEEYRTDYKRLDDIE